MELKCECETIDWVKYNKNYSSHCCDKCISCYCKYSRDEITYDEYQKKCILSPKNNGFKFKEVCMISS